MPALERIVKACANFLACAGLIALLLFAAATLADGLLRTFLNNPIDAVRDLGPFVVAAAVSACFPLAILHRSNIRIDLVRVWLGPRTERLLERAIAILMLIVLAAMTRQLFLYAEDAWQNGDTTVLLEIETYPFWFFVAGMFAVTTLTQAAMALTPSFASHGTLESLRRLDDERSLSP